MIENNSVENKVANHLEKVKKEHPHRKELWYLYYCVGTYFHFAEHSYPPAILAYQKCIKEKPCIDKKFHIEGLAYLYMGYCHEALKEYKKALLCYEKVIELGCIDMQWELAEDPYNHVAWIHLLLENYQKAEKLYQFAIEKNPMNGDNYLELGWLYHLQRDFDNAINWYQKGIDEANKFFYHNTTPHLLSCNRKKYKEYMQKAIAKKNITIDEIKEC